MNGLCTENIEEFHVSIDGDAGKGVIKVANFLEGASLIISNQEALIEDQLWKLKSNWVFHLGAQIRYC